MPNLFILFANGTKMIFDYKSASIEQNRIIDTKRELRITRALNRKSSLSRAAGRIAEIKNRALNGQKAQLKKNTSS